MSRKGVRLVILCEDLLHATFARRFLMKRGFGRHDLRVCDLPRDRGCAEQYVRERFPRELRAYRSKCKYLGGGLVVVIDADRNTVQERIGDLDEACRRQGISTRQDDERVMYAIPKRNIATWLAYLEGGQVNEEDDDPECERRYKHNESTCQPQVERLDSMCRAGKLDGAPPSSLQSCCEGFERFRALIEQSAQR
jgi:hypothetical protein